MSESKLHSVEGAFDAMARQMPDVTEAGNRIIADTTRAASVEGGVPFGEYMVGGVGDVACATSICSFKEEEPLPPLPPKPEPKPES